MKLSHSRIRKEYSKPGKHLPVSNIYGHNFTFATFQSKSNISERSHAISVVGIVIVGTTRRVDITEIVTAIRRTLPPIVRGTNSYRDVTVLSTPLIFTGFDILLEKFVIRF